MSKKTQKPTKLHIKKDDVVMVIAGADKGKKGKVLFIDKKKNRAIVEGVNLVHKHLKPNATFPNGAIEKREAGVHLSNLMHIDPKTGEVTRIGRKEEDGVLVRYAKKSGEVIDK